MRSYWLLFFPLFIIVFESEAQENISRDKYIDEVVLPTTYLRADIVSLLESGYRGFIVDESSEINDLIISGINNFLIDNPEEFLGFIQLDTEGYSGDLLYSHLTQKIIYIDRQYLPSCDSLLKQKKQILFFSNILEEKKLLTEDYLTFAEVGNMFPRLSSQIFTKYDPANLFTAFTFSENLTVEEKDSSYINTDLSDAALNFIKKTGKIPNFIHADDPAEVKKFLDRLPLYMKLSVINRHGNPLSDVKFKEFMQLSTKGITHILAEGIVIDNANIFRENFLLTPYKNGYRFIPEIYTFNYNNYNLYKIFKAQRIDLDSDLEMHLHLSGKELHHPDYPVEIISSTIEFINDSEHGKVAVFNGMNSGIYLDSDNMSDMEESFSIVLWARPDLVKGNFPFFSKAGSYCLKIRNGNLCLTVMDIADLESDRSPVGKDQWQHIGIVYEKGSNITYFIDGAVTDIIPAIDYKVMESGFIIGTNQWDEYYKGEISDVLVWNRPLGEDEIRDLYTHGIRIRGDESFINSLSFKLLAGSLAILILLTFQMKRRKKELRKTVLRPQERTEYENHNELKSYIRCFGEFGIFDKEGNDLAGKLSSKKSSFLLVVLYYTLTEGGITPRKLANIFWPGYNLQRAKNVRGTYIQEIRSVLPGNLLTIIYNHKKWKVRFSTDLYCDLGEVLFLEKSLVSETGNGFQIDENNLNAFLHLIRKGIFAEGKSNEFVDSVKLKVSEQIMDRLEMILKECSDNSMDPLILKIADVILFIDPLHEEVFKQKMEILLKQNNKHDALKCFEKFNKSWQQYFDEPYIVKFTDF